MQDNTFQPGQKLLGFFVEHVDELPAINATMIRLRHEKTGARFMHLDREDTNNLFSVGFRTPPDDSTGVAHILEHTALCGSQRFPVRDPFFSMLKRSLNTFMNAMTASDWTMYPFSSQNQKDFRNLLDIYLDAAFFPLLNERDFSQEGHRVEFENPEDVESPLVYKGVVYNEMKGAMSDPSSLLSRRMGRALYPTTTYHHNSGGEPADIPTLSWQQLRDFHARYYHPSNAWFFSYGNLDLKEHLQFVEDRVLCKFDRIEPDSAVPAEERLTEPKRVTETFPLDAGEPLGKKSLVQVAWLTCDIEDSFERLALTVLSSLLLGNPAAPLYKALLDSGLGDNLAPGTGYQDDIRTTYFAAGLQGTDPEHLPAIEKLILETLEEVAQKGFSSERIEGVLHRLEISNREVSGDSYPYSLILLMRLIGSWIHDADPLDALNFAAHVERLRREVKQGPFFENLLRRNLLDNQHRVSLLLKPDVELGPQQEAEARRKLDALQATLGAAEKEEILTRAAELQKAQESEEDLSCLPTLELSDIDRQEQEVAVVKESVQGVPVFWFAQPTNGIGFVTLNFPVENLPEELLPYLPIFCNLLSQVGAGERDYMQMAEEMEAVTGGIQARTSLLEDPADLESFQAGIQVKGKALLRNLPALFDLLADLCLTPDFSDLQRLQTVLNQIKISLENSVPSSGHTYAARSAAACLTPVGRLRELWSGLEQVSMVAKQAEQPAAQLQELADKMNLIAKTLFSRDQLQAAVAVEQDNFAAARAPLGSFLQRLPETSSEQKQKNSKQQTASRRQGWVWSIPVSYVTKVFRTVPYRDPQSAALMVLAKLLRAEYLHREIREKGGAYGGMASYNSESGLFSLLSYRDPHILRTLNVYDDAVEWVISGDFSDESIKEAILAVFSDLDRPLSPSGQAAQEFANLRQGLTLEMRNELRGKLLAVDRKALISAAETYLRQDVADHAVSVLAGEAALEKANAELGDRKLELHRS